MRDSLGCWILDLGFPRGRGPLGRLPAPRSEAARQAGSPAALRGVAVIAAALWMSSTAFAGDLRIEVSRQGWVVVPRAGVAAKVDEGACVLRRGGEVVPFRPGTEGDLLAFWSDGPSPNESVAVYRLSAEAPLDGARFAEMPGDSVSLADTVGQECRRLRVFEEDRLFESLSTDRFDLIGLDSHPWLWERLALGVEKAVDLDLVAPQGGPARFCIELQPEREEGGLFAMEVLCGGQQAAESKWDGPERHTMSFEVSADRLAAAGGRIAFRLRSAGKKGAAAVSLYLDRIGVDYPVRPVAVADSFLMDLPPDAPEGAYRVFGFSTPDVIVVDVLGARCIGSPMVRGVRPEFEVRFRHPGGAARYAVVGVRGRIAPSEVRHGLGGDLATGGADLLIIAPGGFHKALAPLVERRRAEGLAVCVATIEEACDFAGDGGLTPTGLAEFVRYAVRHWDPAPRYLLLVGDADRDTDRYSRGGVVPSHIVDTLGPGWAGSDHPYVCVDEDDLPDLAVGRLPARTAEELAGMVERIRAYEDEPAGEWTRRVSLGFGTARHGEEADQMLRGAAMQMVSGMIPTDLDFEAVSSVQLGTPYACAPPDLKQRIMDRLNRGCLIFAYAGHGWVDRLEALEWKGEKIPILSKEDVTGLAVAGGNPLGVFFACYTGKYDALDKECLAESAVRAPDGFIAVAACSGQSHPYADSVFAKELIHALLVQRPERLGDAFRTAKQRILRQKDAYRVFMDQEAGKILKEPAQRARLLRDQLFLYNLFGDPTLRVRFPEKASEPRVTGDLSPGGRLSVEVGDPLPEGARVSVRLERERLRFARTPFAVTEDDPDLEAHLRENFVLTQDVILAQAEGAASVVEITAPDSVEPGNYWIKVALSGSDGRALRTGATRVRLRRRK